MYEEINNLTKSFQPRLCVIKDKYGKTLTESEKILGRWKEYCADMYSGDSQINTSLDTGITSEQEEPECKTPLKCEIKRAINSRIFPINFTFGDRVFQQTKLPAFAFFFWLGGKLVVLSVFTLLKYFYV